MTNQEIIDRKFKAFLEGVHKCGNLALRDQMERTLEQSLNLHRELESGVHAHHTTESDTHGWAVADGNGVFASGASLLSQPNRYGSAEDAARKEAEACDGMQKGVFSVVMVNPVEGGGDHTGEEVEKPGVNDIPPDSLRFESKLQELLKTSARMTFKTYMQKNRKAAMRK